jgi:hypothetical protein
MKVGITGLEYSGRKSLFALLAASNKEGSAARSEVVTVNVPDERIDFLADFYKAPKIVYSKIEFLLLGNGAAAGGQAREDGSPVFSKDAAAIDMFGIVVRQFSDPSVFHPLETIDPVRDYSKIKDELVLSDLMIAETRLDRIEKQLRLKDDAQLLREKAALEKAKASLESGACLNRLVLSEEEKKAISTLPFMSVKPIFVIVNCDEASVSNDFHFPDGVKSINISVKIEHEIQLLPQEERTEFLKSLGLKETSLGRIIKFAYSYGDLISFITAGPKESHSWTIKNGSTSLKAAGTIHSDLEKGFIRAEVIGFEDLKNAGSEAEAKKQALYKLHGKDYIIRDGDIIEIRFNISR